MKTTRRGPAIVGFASALFVAAVGPSLLPSITAPPPPPSSAAPPAIEVRTLVNVRVPMRDGVELAADVTMPVAAGPFPVIFERTPYFRSRDRNVEIAQSWARRGYAYVKQDVRGRGDSGGQFTFFSRDGDDGFDSVEWLARQDWSAGRVALVGGSYSATVAWLAARERPPHLVCMIPRAPVGRYLDEIPYTGGAFLLEWNVRWTPGMTTSRSPDAPVRPRDLEAVYRHRPLLTLEEAMGVPMPLAREFLTHPTLDEYWRRLLFTAADFAKITVPTLAFTGWFDLDQPGTISYWGGMRRHSAARDGQLLVIGPWTHGEVMRGGSRVSAGGRTRGESRDGLPLQGAMVLSADAVIDDTALAAAFLDHHLKGGPAPALPRARVYVTGQNRWRDFDEYPPRAVAERHLYLHSAGKANSAAGDGRLDPVAPAAEPPDAYTYDPANPVPFSELSFGTDQQEVERRADVLVYTTAALEKPLTIVGRAAVELHAASDARDTDFVAKLVDVSPDGTAVKLGPKVGVMRARFRQGYEKERLLTPGRVERYRIELFDVGHTFRPGHRVRLEITSSAYPAVAPNANTGHPVATDTESRVAHQQVHHAPGAASHLVLPVLEE